MPNKNKRCTVAGSNIKQKYAVCLVGGEIVYNVFEMAAMLFPCNGHLLCCVNIPTVLLMFFNKLASCSIPYFN